MTARVESQGAAVLFHTGGLAMGEGDPHLAGLHPLQRDHRCGDVSFGYLEICRTGHEPSDRS